MAEADIQLSRRGFMAGAAASGLVLGFCLGHEPAIAAVDVSAANPLFDTWLRIGRDGRVTVLVNCVEMGQGSQTGFAQIAADELDVEWNMVSVEQAPIEKTYYNAWDLYSTGGSGAIRQHFDKLRKTGAAARTMLVEAAAQRWKVPATECRAELGKVVHQASGRALGYGDLVESAASLPVPSAPVLKQPSDWRYIGKPVPRLDLNEIVDGSNVYGVDVRFPGLLVATIMQAPVFGGRLAGIDERPAMAVLGVRHVVRLSGGRVAAADEDAPSGRVAEDRAPIPDAVAVVADGYWAATKGLAALKPRWRDGEMAKISSADVSAGLRKAMREAVATGFPSRGDQIAARRDVDRALRDASRRIEAEYEVPLLSQSPLEPMNGTAWVRDGKAELWLSTQSQSTIREAIAKALEMPIESVTIHTTRLGGGFGRRLESDYGVQAALISKAVGAPVKLIWSRQEDTKHGYYRPAAVARFEGGLNGDGKPVALHARIGAMEAETAAGLDINLYDVGPAVALESRWNPGVPLGSWRSVSPSYTQFFLESFIDELAAAASADPLVYRRNLLAGQPRMLRVLDAVADASGWGRAAPGRHLGVATVGRAWRSFCAQVVELSVTNKSIQIHKITCAIDSGTVVNPDQARAQVEGGIIFGLGAALAQQITLEGGRVEQSTFRDFPVLHMTNTPPIETVFISSPNEPIGGFGEPPVPPIAPALCNALFAATGDRVRRLPLSEAGYRLA